MNKYLNGEIWKDVPGYEGIYQISNMGRVLSFKQSSVGRILSHDPSRYNLINLFTNGHCIRKPVKDLVYSLFIGDIPQGCYVYYKDKLYDDSVNNLILKYNKYNVGDIVLDHYKIKEVIYDPKLTHPYKYRLQCVKCKYEFIRTTIDDSRRKNRKFQCLCYGFPIGSEYKGFKILKRDPNGTYRLQCTNCGKIIHSHLSSSKRLDTNITKCGCYNRRKPHESFNSLRSLCSRHASMMSRCYNMTNHGYNNYGGKGIFVCKYWHNIQNYSKFILESTNGDFEWLVCDRIDPRYEYAPYNCQMISCRDNSIKMRQDNNRTKFQLKIDYLKFKRRKKNWIRYMTSCGYAEEDLI